MNPGNSPGTRRAAAARVGVRRYHELFAWQLSDAFKGEVFRLVRQSPAAAGDYRYRSQIVEAAAAVSKDIAEGFLRCAPKDFARFLGFAIGSLVEAEGRLRDGIELGYFTPASCPEAFRLARRASVTISRLKVRQLRYATDVAAESPAPRSRRTRSTRGT